MRTKAVLFFTFFVAVLPMNARPAAAQSRDDQRWIDQLKKTPVGQIEAGLSEASFADWFADLVKPSQTEYEVKECQETYDPSAPTNRPRLLCVFAYTKPLEPDWNRAIQLNFVVGVLTPSKKETTDAKPVPCRFLGGFEGPSNPKMKRPTRRISKLSELGRHLRGICKPPEVRVKSPYEEHLDFQSAC
jgi:hypothetical protein